MKSPEIMDSATLVRLGSSLFAGVFVLFLLSFYLPLTSKSVNNIFYIGLAIPCVLIAAFNPKATGEIFKDFSWLILIIVVLSVLDSNDVQDLKNGVYLLSFFMACIVAGRGQGNVKTYVLIFSSVSVLVLVFATADWISVWMQTSEWVRQFYWLGEAIHPGFFSLLICFGILSAWVFGVSDWLESRSSKPVYALGFLLVSFLVLLCATVFQSRTALLGFSLFFFGFLVREKKVLLGVSVIAGLVILAFFFGFYDVLLSRGSSYRFVIWQEVIRQLTTECNIWIGCATDGKILGEYDHPHNAYLAMLYRNGILGATVFLAFMVIFFTKTIRARSRWMLLSLFGWGSLLTENSSLFTSPRPFWIYFWLPIFMAILESERKGLRAYFERK